MRVLVTMSRSWRVFTLLYLAVSLTGCQETSQYAPPPPPKVKVEAPVRRNVTEYLEFTGTARAVQRVEIRARVKGFLESAAFVPGSFVEKDQLLYVIDQKPFRAALQEAEAGLERAKARVERARIELDRAQRLFKKGAGTDVEVVQWRGDLQVSRADVIAAEAVVETAKLNLGYTEVRAPIEGLVGKNEVDVGNLVGAGDFTVLTIVEKYNPIYAYFNIDERELLRIMKVYRERDIEMADPEDRLQLTPLFLGLADEDGYPHKGRVDWADLGVDADTGTILVRGIFENPRPVRLLAGMFVRLRMPVENQSNVLLVRERAIGYDQRGAYVLIVDQEDIVRKRGVELGGLYDGMRAVKDGLTDKDRIIVDGLLRANPGFPVIPEMTVNKAASLKTNAGSRGESTAKAKP